MDARYYYYRDAHRRPLITICRLQFGNIYGYGWAICSPRDNPHKDDLELYDSVANKVVVLPGGRSIAHGRARRALERPRQSVAVEYGGTYRAVIWKHRVQRVEALQTLLLCCPHLSDEYMALTALFRGESVSGLPPSMRPPEDAS